MKRDPGLQPERTGMSWMRTLMLLFGIGVLFFKVGELHQHYYLAGLGLFCCLIAVASTLYVKQRFTKPFTDDSTVSRQEYEVKQWLSAMLMLLALGYLCSLWLS